MEWGLILGVVLALPVAMYFLQDRLLFHLRPVPETTRALIAQSSPGVESVFMQAADGTRLHAWYRKGSPLVLYFGGNAEEVSWMLARAARNAPQTGWLLVDYRGYGSSEGAPSQDALIKDAMQWYAWATEKLAPQNIVLFGRSLGSGVVVQIAAARPVAGVVLVTPYDSLTSVARHHYPYLPVGWMLKHPFDSLEHAPGITAPLLCLVAARDDVIPIVHSKRLFDAWKGPKRWVELEGAGHNDTDDAPAFWQAIREFLVQPD
jgi:pimeloyl-ACP methyl ester carboxylesterase